MFFAQNYYDRFVPCLKYIIQNATSVANPDLRLLRGKTIECISLIGLAVGTEKFSADANEVMDMLLKTQTGDTALSDDDPQVNLVPPFYIFLFLFYFTTLNFDRETQAKKFSELQIFQIIYT